MCNTRNQQGSYEWDITYPCWATGVTFLRLFMAGSKNKNGLEKLPIGGFSALWRFKMYKYPYDKTYRNTYRRR